MLRQIRIFTDCLQYNRESLKKKNEMPHEKSPRLFVIDLSRIKPAETRPNLSVIYKSDSHL